MGVAILVLVGGLVLGFLGLGFYARRGEGKPDRPGERSTVSFSGGSALLAEDELSKLEEDGLYVGLGTITAVLAKLNEAGISANEPQPDVPGWAAHIGEPGAQSYLLLGEMDEDRWLLILQDPSSGGPGRTEHLQPIDDALRAIPALSDIRWIPRGTDPFGDGTDSPFDEAPAV